jgi:hypothetical protein
LSTIGTAGILGELAVADGQMATISVIFTGDASAVSATWSGPAGTTAPVATERGLELSWRFAAATDTGAYSVSLDDPAATDSPQTAAVMMTGLRLLERFGRTYQAFDPDGPGPGPSTWILAGPGAGGDGGGGSIPPGSESGSIDGSVPGRILLGQALMMTGAGALQPADPSAYASSIVVGIAVSSGGAGEPVSYVVDGIVTIPNWSAITRTVELNSGARYFLAPGGLLATQPPVTGYAAPVGRAVGPFQLEVEVGSSPIKVG